MLNVTAAPDTSGATIENLYPALTECFAIILCGYAAGRMNMISETEAKGINTFVGTFSLPSLIFMSLAQLDLSSVNWLFLLAILIAKSIVFFSVIVVTLLVGRPVNFGRAGIFAIFCTQSNDFAIGYPIVAALYKNSHPEYASYLYLMAPISLAILNPISFVFMEIGRRNGGGNTDFLLDGDLVSRNMYRFKMVVSVTKSIFLNPIVLMTILGILGNWVFRHHIPCYLGGVLDVLGSAFSASALFLLGLRMVGKVHKLRGATLVVPGILIMVKLIALPLVTREVVSIIHVGYNKSETVDLSTYGFLYGTFPSAPTVFVFATQYFIDVDLIASAMVACTFISAPLMFVSAKMITITKTDPSEYIKQLDSFTLDISIVAIIACGWVILVFILTKKIARLPHKITACLIISQLISCLGAVLYNTLPQKDNWSGYIPSIFIMGVYSTRLWTTILAVTLLFLQCRSLCYVLKLQPIFFTVGWGIPAILTVVLLLFDGKNHRPLDKRNPNFVYGTYQAIVAIALLVLCFIVTAGCLILQQRYHRRFTRYLDLAQDISDSPSTSSEIETNIESPNPGTSSDSGISPGKSTKCGGLPTINEGCCEESPVDIEDLFPVNGDTGLCPSRFGCQGPKREQCQGIVRQYQETIDDDLEFIEEEPELHEPQFLRHTVLLILLLCSMFVGLAISIWTLVMEQISGIYIELSFLDATLNFGQSIIVFGIFGLEVKEVVLPLLKLKRLLWYGSNSLVLPSWHELSPETRHICDQFITHHLQSCRNAIATDKRWRIKVYKSVFTGIEFVDWLITVGLARDRGEAVNYARHLIEGKVLKHINGVYHFYDRNLLYTFV
ncbi:lysosomal cholesterol signaling protein isoform X2 [Tribolium castaneum]|uniref:Integral membrane protein GPR155-like Protein n=2 Tax=Tribolium castaneum TaxID=7070 RepID=D7GXJ5_TRICA|nr:PREDICTED: integral membrane protein GPR155 isoform X2 [Tribolium castaneum]EFA13400.1 Integral membrane protein GPR155-like Protein [Tribolium castaneum]|eukprot:XP_008194884.1 PREDICTED: integral membrane protein GPR155 isoform X2 [Tribolium castaneum]